MLKSVSKPITTVMAVTTLEVVEVPTPAAPPFDVEAAMTRDRTDEQPEQQALDDPGDDVLDQRGFAERDR